jgi:hypothetical protein
MKKIFLALLVFFILKGQSQNSCLPFWNNLQTFTLTNPNNYVLSDYQVRLTVNTQSLISANLMNVNGDDIRFTVGSCSLIPYYIESGINTNITSIWIKVPLLPASGTLAVNMYYNNPTVTAQSNGDLVFEFFDDFNDGAFNTTKWSVQGTPQQLVESNGTVNIVGNNNWEYFKSTTTFTSKLTIDGRFYMNGNIGPVIGIGGTDNRFTFRNNGSTFGTCFDNDVINGNTYFDSNYPGIAAPTATFQEVQYAAELLTNTITISNFCNVTAAACNNASTALTTYTGTSYYIGFSSWSQNMVVDIIKVRKFADVEPSVINGDDMLNPYIFSDVMNPNVLCAGYSATVSAISNGSFVAGNMYSVEMSDAAGNFSAAVSIGTLNSTNSGTLSIPVTIPLSAMSGTAYLFRVNSSNQSIIGTGSMASHTVEASPNLTTSSTSSVLCLGNSATLSVSGANTYTWSNNTNSTSIVVSPTVTTSYTISGSSANGCVSSAVVTQVVSACTDLKEESERFQASLVYPNPFSSELNFTSGEEVEMQMMNALGQVIRSAKFNGTHTIETAELPTGVYMIYLKANSGTKSLKVIKN